MHFLHETRSLSIVPDPLPNRNVFTRTDQFSFVREGIPAPSDDPQQPVLPEDAVKLDGFVAAVTLRIANAVGRPKWLADSIFAKTI